MTLVQLLIDEAEVNYAITAKLFGRVDDSELSWTPGEGRNWMTVGQLLWHLANAGCGKAIEGFVKGDWGAQPGDADSQVHVPPAAALPSAVSVHQALQLLADDRRLALSAIALAGEASLLEREVAAPWGGRARPLFQQLLHMIAHLAQHKGQLFYYLKLMGKDVNTADLWGTED